MRASFEEMDVIITTRDIAERLGVTPRRVLQLAARLGIRPVARIGRADIWSDDAAERLARGRLPSGGRRKILGG